MCVVILACLLLGVALAESESLSIAEQAGFGAMAEHFEEHGFDAWGTLKSLLNGDGADPSELLRSLADGLLAQVRERFAALMKGLAVPVIVCGALRLLSGREAAALGMARLLCSLCCAATLMAEAASARQTAEAFLDTLNGAASALTPVLVSVATLTGAGTTASILTPMAAQCAAVIDMAFRNVGLRLCAAACGVAVAGCLSNRYPLDRLFGLMMSAARWLLTLSMFLFGLMMSARGLMGAARDSAAIQAAKLALENLVPVVGGDLSGSAGSLSASAGVIRRAVGLTGVTAIVCVCAAQLLKLGASAFSMKLIAALLEPLAADAPAVALIDRFGQVASLLLALCACAAVLTALLAGGLAVAVAG